MKTFKVTRTESTEYTTTVYAATHEEAESLARARIEKGWTQQGYYVDYVPLLVEGDDDE